MWFGVVGIVDEAVGLEEEAREIMEIAELVSSASKSVEVGEF